MESLQMFDVMSEEELTEINGGYNRLAGQIGHYTGKAVVIGASIASIASLF